MIDIEKEAVNATKVWLERHPPKYSQIPTALMRNPKVSGEAKALYGVLHSWCPQKNLSKIMKIHCSEKTMGQAMGKSDRQIRRNLKELQKAGWLDISRSGPMKSNYIYLYGENKKNLTAIETMRKIGLRVQYDKVLADRLLGDRTKMSAREAVWKKRDQEYLDRLAPIEVEDIDPGKPLIELTEEDRETGQGILDALQKDSELVIRRRPRRVKKAA